MPASYAYNVSQELARTVPFLSAILAFLHPVRGDAPVPPLSQASDYLLQATQLLDCFDSLETTEPSLSKEVLR